MGNDDVQLDILQEGEKYVIGEWERRKKILMISNLSNRHIKRPDEEEAPQGFCQRIMKIISFSDKKTALNIDKGLSSDKNMTTQDSKKPSKLKEIISMKKLKEFNETQGNDAFTEEENISNEYQSEGISLDS